MLREVESQSHAHDDPSTRLVDNYSFNKRNCLGEGSFGKVFRGKDSRSNSAVAVKKIELRAFLHDNFFLEKVLRQIRILNSLTHPHIVRLLDALRTDSQIYQILQLCSHGDLRTLIKKGQTDETQAVSMFSQLVSAFLLIDSLNIIHNDIKPANVLLSNREFKIADFSIATQDGLFSDQEHGCILYKSPQKLKGGKFSSKSDVWSLGVIFYQMIFKQTPWFATDPESLLDNIYCNKILIKKNYLSTLSERIILATLSFSQKQRASWKDLASLLSQAKMSHSLKSTGFSDNLQQKNLLWSLAGLALSQLRCQQQQLKKKMKNAYRLQTIFQLLAELQDTLPELEFRQNLSRFQSEFQVAAVMLKELANDCTFGCEILTDLIAEIKGFIQSRPVRIPDRKADEQYWKRIKRRLE